MKHSFKFLILAAPAYLLGADAVPDPVRDYLSQALSQNGYLERFYSDDKVLILEVDLNGDRANEKLVCLTRDNSARAGNNWMAYRRVGDLYEPISRVTFSSSRFYLGRVEEIGGYGLLNFWPSGAGEGGFIAYTYDGSTIRKTQVGTIVMDRQTYELKGGELLGKYFGETATLGDRITTVITAQEFGAKYGIEIDPRTHHESVLQYLAAKDAAVVPKSIVQPKPAANTISTPSTQKVLATEPNKSSPAASEESDHWRWIIGLGLVALAGALVWLKLLRR